MSKSLIRRAKNVVNGYSGTQVVLREATSNDSDGPSVELLDEIADRSFDNVSFFEIMDMLDKRLNDKGKNWRHVAKSLTVLDYLVRCGSENCVPWVRENLYIIKTLREFTHEDEFGIDQGQIVRVKARELTSLLLDDERLREERQLRQRDRRPRRRRTPDMDDDLQRALEESKLTAEQEEEDRRRRYEMYDNSNDDLQTAIQLSKEEEELKRLRELQRQQQMQQAQGEMFGYGQQPQQPALYYDVFGNPITAEEYLQYQQQMNEQLAQQQLAQQQFLAQQQYLAMQQQQDQQALAQQQYLQSLAQQQQQQQQPLATGSNNPFALGAQSKTTEAPSPQPVQPPRSEQRLQNLPPQSAMSAPQQPLRQTRTGNQSISDKYSDLNNLLASGSGLDTFGNTGQTRIPAQHTKTGTFINSQGTGYKQVTNEAPQGKKNPFLAQQYTGLPSTSVVPSYTGYGFGNGNANIQQQPHQQSATHFAGSGTADQGVSLIDL
ncbi:LADA_0E14180g1_1 [Lachancea dasiensis]|uniref:LADA_0E14180g1_1 n=1 Tax=Lachancea dasiensis TaxID=1072105 RepID=A0A1G4JFX1_9SACH|nr:LADA_0E14180g1_1 [Lachancea dasiensis]